MQIAYAVVVILAHSTSKGSPVLEKNAKQPKGKQQGNSDAQDAWTKCPEGMIHDLAVQLQHDKQQQKTVARRKFLTVTVAASALVGLPAAAYFLRKPNDHIYLGGLTCGEVKPQLPAYQQKRLSEEMTRKIQMHLVDCPKCRKRLEQMA